MLRLREGITEGCEKPKDGELTVPGVREGFLEEVAIGLGTSKTQLKVLEGVPVEE